MKELLPTINEILKYSLEPDLAILDRNRFLEKNLVKLYSLYFDIVYKFDETNFPDFVISSVDKNIRQNIIHNFPYFKIYKKDFNKDIESPPDMFVIGDPVYDLTEILVNLLEIKWRIENTSMNDGLWFFELSFYTSTQQQILDLLSYMKQLNG